MGARDTCCFFKDKAMQDKSAQMRGLPRWNRLCRAAIPEHGAGRCALLKRSAQPGERGNGIVPTSTESPRGPATASRPAARRGAATAAPAWSARSVLTVAVQAADAVLAERGWTGWISDRFGDERTEHRVELCFESPDGRRGGFDICVDESTAAHSPTAVAIRRLRPSSRPSFIVTRLRSWT